MSGSEATPGRRGRPPCCPPELARRIVGLHLQGFSYARICAVLNAEQIPTPLGSPCWYKSHICRLLATRYAQEFLQELKRHAV